MFSQAPPHLGAQEKAEAMSLLLPLQEAEQVLLEDADPDEKLAVALAAFQVVEVHSQRPEEADGSGIQRNLLRTAQQRASRAVSRTVSFSTRRERTATSELPAHVQPPGCATIAADPRLPRPPTAAAPPAACPAQRPAPAPQCHRRAP